VRTVVRTKTRTKLKTIVKVRTRIRTITKTLRPDVPSTAFVPSTHPALAQTSFLVQGGNVGCHVGPGWVSCSVLQRVWAAPAPASCKTSWGNTVFMQGAKAAKFVCGGSSAISPSAKVIPDGWDNKVGNITCQIRRVGVDCFSKQRHGFVISGTGYATY
jgi:hypothetical protein